MITMIRTVAVQPGRMGAAVAFAHEVAKHLNRVHGGDLRVMLPVGGNPNEIAWHSTWPDLATVEKVIAAMAADAELGAMIARAAEHMIPGSTLDRYWRG
jgi:hypothetical protein